MEPRILRWMIRCALQECFCSRVGCMAAALHVHDNALEQVLAEDDATEAPYVFEQLMEYCLMNSISMDKMLAKYKGHVS